MDEGRGIYSVAMFHVGASFISLAPTFFQKSERAHAAAPPFQITTANAGLRFGFGCKPESCGIYTVAIFHVVAKFALRPRFFIPMAKKTHPPAPLLLLSKSQPLMLGCDLVLGTDLEARHLYCCDISRRSKVRFAPAFLCLQQKASALMHSLALRANPNFSA